MGTACAHERSAAAAQATPAHQSRAPTAPSPQALDAARGLHHLHSHAPPIIHRDIKVGAHRRVGAGSSAAASVAAHAAGEGQLASAEVPAAVHTEWPLPPPQSPNLLIDYGWRAKVAE